MDTFEQLEIKVAAAAGEVVKIGQVVGRRGLRDNPDVKRALQGLVDRLNACVNGPVTEEFMQGTLELCDRSIPTLMAAIEAGRPQ